MNSTKDVWAAVLDMLATKLTTTTINTWFRDCEPIELEEGRLVLYTASPFRREVIEKRFTSFIQDALKELFSADFSLLILSGEELAKYQEGKKEQKPRPEMDDGYTFDNFIVGSSNRLAHAASLGVVKNPGKKAYNPLFIYGSSGLGKTHLLLAIGNAVHENTPEAKIIYVKGDEFLNDVVTSIKEGIMEEFRQKYRFADLFLVDDIQFIAGKDRSQEEFFHTFNNIYEAGHQIVVTSDRPPLDMPLLEDRLRTRFEGGLMVDIKPPDQETRMAIIRDKAGHLGVALSDVIVERIAEQIRDNVRQIEGVVKKLTAYQDLSGERITIEQVDMIIADVIRTGIYTPKPDDIIEETARYYQINPEDIKGKRRSKNIATARHISVYLIRTLTDLSLTDIGKYYGSRDHTTIMNSLHQVEKNMQTNPEVAATIRDITTNLTTRQR